MSLVINKNKSIMKNTLRLTVLSSAALGAFFMSSCAEPAGPQTQRGAVIGGLGGAALGGIVGHQSGRGLEGAAIGGALGAGAGAMMGNARDQEERRYYAPPPQRPHY
jgi:uncharacterized membrane protein YebE (DUF533 family)